VLDALIFLRDVPRLLQRIRLLYDGVDVLFFTAKQKFFVTAAATAREKGTPSRHKQATKQRRTADHLFLFLFFSMPAITATIATMPEHQFASYARFDDLARVFDDDDIALFSNAVRDDGLAEKEDVPTGADGFASSPSLLRWGNPPGSNGSFLLNNPTATQLQEAEQLKLQQQQQQPSLSSEEFVSAYVVIDPSQPDRILVPHQLLTYTPPGCSEALSVTWGPVVLPSSLLSASSSIEFPTQATAPPPQQQSPSLPAAASQQQQEQEQEYQASSVHTQLDNTKNTSDTSDKEPTGSNRDDETLPMPCPLAASSSAAAQKRAQSSDLTTTKTLASPPTNRKKSKTCRAKRSRAASSEATDGNELDAYGEPKMLKPLTAYNFYYRDERDNICLATGDEVPPPVSDFSEAKRQKLLGDRWLRDPTKGKRKHRKTHGKMEFTK